MRSRAELSPPEIASFLAAKAIAAATAFLDGRSDGAALGRAADQLIGEMLLVNDPACNALADPTRLLVISMLHGAVASGTRAQRWRAIMLAFVDLVRVEAGALRETTESSS